MSVLLDPIVERRVDAFRARRQTMFWIRGIAIAIAAFVLASLAVVTVDAWMVLEPWSMWLLSGAVYGAGLLSILWTWSQSRKRSSDRSTIAMVIETAEPRLKEKLLSAVELAGPDELDRKGSTDFRNALQRQVAEAITDVEIPKLLPWKLLRRSALAAILLVAVTAGLSLVPGLQLPYRLARTWLPLANLDRISAFSIEIIEPNGNSSVAAIGDFAPVIARVSGPESFKTGSFETGDVDVYLETRSAQASSSRSPIPAAVGSEGEDAKGRFQGSLAVVEGQTEYRVVAGDARSAWRTIVGKDRPEVEQFVKEITPPPYTKLSAQNITENQGDVQAMIGSTLKLQLKCNQSIEKGTLWYRTSTNTPPTAIELKLVDSMTLEAVIPITTDASYHVELVSSETKFATKFPKSYSIDAMEDAPPKIRWTEPLEAMQLVRSNDIISAIAQVEDDTPVDEVIQRVKINDQNWTENALTSQATATQEFKLESDLLPLKLNNGDWVQWQLVARDRKGQATESETIEFFITPSVFDNEQRETVRLRLDLASKLHDMREAAKLVAEESKKVIQQVTAQPEWHTREADKKAIRDSVLKFAETVEQERAKIAPEVLRVMRGFRENIGSAELEQVGELLARLEKEQIPSIQFRANSIETNLTSDEIGKWSKELLDQVNAIDGHCERLEIRMKDFVVFDVLSAAKYELAAIYQFQEQLKKNIDSVSRAKYLRQQSVVSTYIQSLEREISRNRILLNINVQTELRNWSDWFNQFNASLAERIDNAPENDSYREIVDWTLNELRSRRNIHQAGGGGIGELTTAWQELHNRSGNLGQDLSRLADSLSRQSAAVDPRAIVEEQTVVRVPATEQIMSRRELHQLRSSMDADYLADLGSAHRAVQEIMRDVSDPKGSVPKMQEVAGALSKLEAVHRFVELSARLENLIEKERWEESTIDAAMAHPRLWYSFNESCENAAQLMRIAGIPGEISSKTDSLRWIEPAGQASQILGNRFWQPDLTVSAARPLEQIRPQIAELKTKLDPIAEEARAILRKYAPSISELATRAQQSTEELKAQTEQLAEQAKKEPNAVEESLDAMQDQQKAAEESVAALEEALTDFANRQDIMQEQQRENAKDADASRELAQQAKQELSESLSEVTPEAEAEQTANELQEAAAQQNEAAKKLEQIAQHFEKLENEKELSESRESLRSLAAQQPPNSTPQDPQNANPSQQPRNASNEPPQSPTEQEYQQAQKLAEMQQQRQSDLLEQLESELKSNPEMRRELARIAESTSQDAQDQIELSAEQQKQMHNQIENSDPDYSEKKQAFQAEAVQEARRSEWVAQQLMETAKQAAARLEKNDRAEQMKKAAEELQAAAREVMQANPQQPAEKLVQAAQKLSQELKEAQSISQEQATAFQQEATQPIHRNEEELKNRKRDAESIQKLMKEREVSLWQTQENDAKRLAQNATNQLKNATNQAEAKQKQLDKSQQQLAKKPEDAGMKQQVALAEKALETAKGVQSKAEQKAAQQKSVQESVSERKEQAQKRDLPSFEQANPIAELAQRINEKAAADTKEAAAELDQLLADTGWNDSLQVPENLVASASQNQQKIRTNLEASAKDLARAARHDQRLGQDKAAESLEQGGKELSEAVSNAVAPSADTLKNTAENLAEQKKANANDPAKANEPLLASSAQSKQIQQSLLDSVSSLQAQSQSLQQKLSDLPENLADEAARTATPADANSGNEPSENNSGNGALGDPSLLASNETIKGLHPATMARMLDELDQRAAEQGAAQQITGDEAEPGANEAPPNSLANAARELKSQMSKSRLPNPESSLNTMDSQATLSANEGEIGETGATAVRVIAVERKSVKEDWGKLRKKNAEDTASTDREAVAPKYRKQVETYFKVLAEQARKEKK